MEDGKFNKEYKKIIIEYLKEKGKANLAELKKLNNQHQPVLYNIRRLMNEKIIRPYLEINPDTVKSIGIMDNEIFFTIVDQYQYPQEVRKLVDEMCGDNSDITSQAFQQFIKLYQERIPWLITHIPDLNKIPKRRFSFLSRKPFPDDFDLNTLPTIKTPVLLYKDNLNDEYPKRSEDAKFKHLIPYENLYGWIKDEKTKDAKKLAYLLMSGIHSHLKEEVSNALTLKDPSDRIVDHPYCTKIVSYLI